MFWLAYTFVPGVRQLVDNLLWAANLTATTISDTIDVRELGLKPLETVTVETGPNPTFSIIWMHGLGADGHDFEPLVPELVDAACRHCASCFRTRRCGP